MPKTKGTNTVLTGSAVKSITSVASLNALKECLALNKGKEGVEKALDGRVQLEYYLVRTRPELSDISTNLFFLEFESILLQVIDSGTGTESASCCFSSLETAVAHLDGIRQGITLAQELEVERTWQ